MNDKDLEQFTTSVDCEEPLRFDNGESLVSRIDLPELFNVSIKPSFPQIHFEFATSDGYVKVDPMHNITAFELWKLYLFAEALKTAWLAEEVGDQALQLAKSQGLGRHLKNSKTGERYEH